MYIYVCVYVRMHVYVCVFVCACMCMRTCMCLYAYVYVYVHACVCVHVHICFFAVYVNFAPQVLALYESMDIIDIEGVVKFTAGLQQADGSFVGDKWGKQ